MTATHTVRVAQSAPSPSSAGTVAPSTASTAATGRGDRILWLQVSVASALGAGAALLTTYVIIATQTLQMHF